jgi:heat-inducible transcriptional repressor
MTGPERLTERELKVLEAVVRSYVRTAEPAGSQALAREAGLGVSPATIRSIMSDLEERGFLFHPHTSAGRVPTDLGYRTFVDGLVRPVAPTDQEQETLRIELAAVSAANATEVILRRTAQVLGVLTSELGVAAAPALEQTVLERIELVPVSSDRILLVFTLRSGVVRTIFVQVPAMLPPDAIQRVGQVLNERLAGSTLRDIRRTLPERLRDASAVDTARELLNLFIAQGEELFDLGDEAGGLVHLGSARHLADQPEFSGSNERMRNLLSLTERRDLLAGALADRRRTGLTITIGGENPDPNLAGFTLVTASYRRGEVSGVIGVLGPTRMPYDKIVSLVDHTSRLVEGLLA